MVIEIDHLTITIRNFNDTFADSLKLKCLGSLQEKMFAIEKKSESFSTQLIAS